MLPIALTIRQGREWKQNGGDGSSPSHPSSFYPAAATITVHPGDQEGAVPGDPAVEEVLPMGAAVVAEEAEGPHIGVVEAEAVVVEVEGVRHTGEAR